MVERIRLLGLLLSATAVLPVVAAPPEKEEWPKPTHTLKGWVGGLAFSPDSKTLVACGVDPDQPPPAGRFQVPDTSIAVWDVTTGKPVGAFKGQKETRTVAFSPDGALIASAGKGGLHLWDVKTGKVVRSVDAHSGQVRTIAFSPDGKFLASDAAIGGDVTVGLWETGTLKRATLAPDYKGNVNTLAFSPDGKALAFGGFGGDSVHVWGVDTGKERLVIEPGRYTVPCAAFAPDGKTLAVGIRLSFPKDGPPRAFPAPPPSQRVVTLYDSATGKSVGNLTASGGPIHSVAYSPDGKLLATANGNERVELFDVATQKVLASLKMEPWPDEVAFSPDGKVLAAGSRGGFGGRGEKCVKLWNLERDK